jgi:hypothetical protein
MVYHKSLHSMGLNQGFSHHRRTYSWYGQKCPLDSGLFLSNAISLTPRLLPFVPFFVLVSVLSASCRVDLCTVPFSKTLSFFETSCGASSSLSLSLVSSPLLTVIFAVASLLLDPDPRTAAHGHVVQTS